MKRIVIIGMALLMCLALPAQKKQTNKRSVPAKTTTVKRKTTTTKRKSAAKKKTNAATYSNASIKGLQNQRSIIQKKIRQQEQALRANQADVKKRLQTLLMLNTAISERQKNIEGIENDIRHINGNIDLLKSQLKTLEAQLVERKANYVKSMRYMARHQRMQDKLMFIFSAKNFAQMYRRLRFVREYAAYQKVQGDMVKNKQAQITDKHEQLQVVKGQKSNLLYKGKKERTELEGQQNEQKTMVNTLQKQQQTIQKVITEQRKKDAALNAQIDRLVAIEVEKARARALAEAKKKAEAVAAAKRRKEELARRKALAEAEARANQQRIAEAKAREAKLKEEARLAREANDKARRERAEQAAREAEANRIAAERKAEVEESRNKKEIAEARKNVEDAQRMSSVDRMMSGGFEANRGRLPMPITGNYRIVSHFGQYNVEGLKNVMLDNKGINIMGSAGCQARAIYDGEVSAVFGYSGAMVVMVRHGAYISVYCNLRSVSVRTGQKVSTRQALGTVGTDNILQFQLRREMAKLNPEAWLGR